MHFDERDIGETLGKMAAKAECDLCEDYRDAEALRTLMEVSEIYKNFARGGFPGFHSDFKRGFDAMMPELYPGSVPKPATHEPSERDPALEP